MGANKLNKINDVSDSKFKSKYLNAKAFVPETNLAVAMARVSIIKNKDKGNSDEDQLENIHKYAEREKIEIVKHWDVAETASKPHRRKKFAQMIEFVRGNPQIKHVLFSHQSRSNRNRVSAQELEDLTRLGVTIHFARDNRKLPPNPSMEELMLWDLYNNLHAKEIEAHTKNVVGGMLKRMEMGLACQLAPFGYENFRLEDQNDLSIFRLLEPQASYVRAMFERFATGRYSLEALKRELDAEFPVLKGKLNVKRFGEILRNPWYYGMFEVEGQLYIGHKDYHPRLITQELFDRVQKVLNQPQRSKRKVTLRNHPYLGLLKCGGTILDEQGRETDEVCGCSVTAEEKRKKLADGTQTTYVYYHCTSVRRCSQQDKRFADAHDFKRNLPESDLEAMFEDILKPLTFAPDVTKWMQDYLLQEHHEKSGDHRQQVAALKRRHEMLQRYVDQAYEDKLAGEITPEEWREKTTKWRSEIEDVLAQIKHADAKKDDYIDRGVELIELVHQLETLYKVASPEKKRRIIEIVSSNHVLANGTLRWDYRKPFDILGSSRITVGE